MEDRRHHGPRSASPARSTGAGVRRPTLPSGSARFSQGVSGIMAMSPVREGGPRFTIVAPVYKLSRCASESGFSGGPVVPPLDGQKKGLHVAGGVSYPKRIPSLMTTEIRLPMHRRTQASFSHVVALIDANPIVVLPSGTGLRTAVKPPYQPRFI